MSPAEIAAAIQRGEKDPMPYAAGSWRSSRPFHLIYGSLTGTAATPPNGWVEDAVHNPRWYTDDQYADQIEHEHRTAVARSRRKVGATS